MPRGDATAISTKFLVIVALCMAFVMSVFAFVLFMLLIPGAAVAPAGGTSRVALADDGSPVLACREGEYNNQCPDGMLCVGTRCVPDAPLPTCEDGELCRYCQCPEPRMCVRGQCVDPEVSTPASAVSACNDPAVQEALQVLVQQCKKRGNSTLEGCEPSDWHDFAMKDDRFDTIMAAFPDRVSVHFPFGKPSRWANWWPLQRTVAEYRTQLLESKEAFSDAKIIFMIGRASPEGAPEVNYRTALLRMDVVRRLMDELYVSGEVNPLGTKIKQFTMGDTRPVQPEFFRNFYANNHVTWDEPSRRQLRRQLGRLDELTRDEKQWVFDTINRVVLVVPVPCDGTEGQAGAAE